MNDLSWLLYLIGISGNIQGTLVFLGFGLGCAGALLSCVFSFEYDRPKAGLFTVLLTVFVCLSMWFTAALIPPRSTLYAIAASQLGEQMIQLEQVQELGGEIGGLATDTIALLRQNIQAQLKE